MSHALENTSRPKQVKCIINGVNKSQGTICTLYNSKSCIVIVQPALEDPCRRRQYYTLLEQKAIILIFISIIDINVNLSKNEIDKKINLS